MHLRVRVGRPSVLNLEWKRKLLACEDDFLKRRVRLDLIRAHLSRDFPECSGSEV